MTFSELPAPIVIPRSEHIISRKDIDREALKVLYKLRDAGHQAYLVGGGVRDLLLGKRPKDFDISTDARPGEIRKIFRNSRIIGRRFRLVQVFFSGNKIIELSTFRQRSEFDAEGEEKVLAANNTFGTPAEDAFRRDLTINALFYEIENFTVIDYTGGVEDLNNGIIKIVGDPDRRITRDPVRIMRVIRHAARTGFVVEENTWQAVLRHMGKLALCPISRIRDEVLKDLKSGAMQAWLKLAVASGMFSAILPVYAKYLRSEAEESTTYSMLTRLFGVVDRMIIAGHNIPEHIMLTILFIPWANTFPEFSQVKTLNNAYQFSKTARNDLQPTLTNLNIKRGQQDSVSRCLSTLPLLLNAQNKNKPGDWPKWLRKKSYFNDGLFAYKIFQEANGGNKFDDPPIVDKIHQTVSDKDAVKKRGASGLNNGPAFVEKAKGGIFGFRRW